MGSTEFFVDGHNLNNIRYSDDTVWIADTEIKQPILPKKVAKKSGKNGLQISYKTEFMVDRKSMSPKYKLQIGYKKIK